MAFSGDPDALKRMLKVLPEMFGISPGYEYSYDPTTQQYTEISGPILKKNRGSYNYSYNPDDQSYTQTGGPGMKKGGKVSSASKRADGCAQRGKTRGKMV